MRSVSPTIAKLYVANFLTGMVFWYGIEKLFLQQIGVGPAEIGWMLAVYTVLILVLDIPSGMLADRWSRKGMLVCAMVFLAISAVWQGTSNDATQYVIGYLFYGLYMVSTSGTYHALVYDVAHEEGQAHRYSKIMGWAYALFLIGAGVADILSGFIAMIDIRLPFWLSIIPCIINIAVILSIKEPQFHKQQQQKNLFAQLGQATKAIWKVLVLRSLVIIYGAFAISELFKQDFSQLYFLVFNNQALFMGFFWAAYAFAWAFGNAIAHRFAHHLSLMLIISLSAFVILSVWQSPWALVVFIIQVVAAAAAHILIETRVQEATPSAVRASVLSVLGTTERLIRLPGSFLLGWLLAQYNVFVTLGVVAALSLLGLLYWLLIGAPRLKATNKPVNPPETYAQI